MECGFSLPYPLQSKRFSKIYEVVPGWWAHRLRITEPSQLDDEIQEWILDSYRLMGMQERWRERQTQ